MIKATITIGGREVYANEERLEQGLCELETGPDRFASIFADYGTRDECRMVMEYIEGYGFYILTLGRGDRTEWLPTEPGFSNELATVVIGNNEEVIPVRVLVTLTTAKCVCREFLQSGTRSGQVQWIDVDTLYK